MKGLQQLINQLCPNGVEWKTLGKLCEINKGEQLNKENMSEVGSYPVINGGICPSGYVEVYNQPKDTITISQGGASAGYVNWMKTEFWAGAHCYVVIPNKEIVSNRYVYHYVKSIESKLQECQYGAGIPALAKKTVEQVQIPLPPLAIQSRIVEILDHFTNLTANLTAELALRRKQFEHFREKLLSLDGVEKGEMKKLGDVYEFKYGEGNTIPTIGGNYPVYGSNGIVGFHNKYNSEDAPVIGHIGAYAGIVNWAKGKHFVTYNGVICRVKDEGIINRRFGYYFLTLQDFMSMANAGSQPFISYNLLNKVQIPVPPLAVQQSIVAKLDKFTGLIQNIENELALRQKQYEYYREKLLSFPSPSL